MWTRSQNGEPVKPLSKEISDSWVIVRKNYTFVPGDEEIPTHWEYDEWQMTAEQYEVYKEHENELAEQSDALVELAEMIAAQDDALVELAGLLEV